MFFFWKNCGCVRCGKCWRRCLCSLWVAQTEPCSCFSLLNRRVVFLEIHWKDPNVQLNGYLRPLTAANAHLRALQNPTRQVETSRKWTSFCTTLVSDFWNDSQTPHTSITCCSSGTSDIIRQPPCCKFASASGGREITNRKAQEEAKLNHRKKKNFYIGPHL